MVNPPPDKEAFIDALPSDQIQMLASAWQKQTASLVSCRIQLDGLAEWKGEVLKRYKQADPDDDGSIRESSESENE